MKPAAPDTVPPGYKRTEVGVIPDEWHVKSVGQIASIRTGPFGTLLKASEYSGTDGVPLVSVGEVGEGKIRVTKDTPRVPEVVTRRLPQYLLRMGDIVFGRKGAVERSALVAEDEDGWFLGSDGIVVRPHPGSVPSYFGWQFQRADFKATILQRSTGTTMPSLNQTVLGEVQIPCAPAPEQRAIATALSDVDALLDGLDRLIAKKRDLKQAAMQQLLTGQTRLPGFEGDWDANRLGELGTFLKGSGVKKDDARSGHLPCVRYGEIYTHHSDYIRSFQSWISVDVAATATRIMRGDLLFAGSGETKEEIGKCVAFVDDFEAYAGGDIVILRLVEAHPVFMGYLCNTRGINAQKASKGQGDAVVHISSAALADVVVRIPQLPEQAAIATVLSDMDAELVALEVRRDKTRLLKQAMMQELLTGRTRLVSAPSNVISINARKMSNSEAAQQPKKPHNWQINEAVVISVLAAKFGSERYPLGRKRCTKLAYLMHRHVERVTSGYLKKAAGPYNPAVKYKGPESIAQKNGYIRPHRHGQYVGFVAAANIAAAEAYFDQWYGSAALSWLEQFRGSTNDELELLATVDMAAGDLVRRKAPVDVPGVKDVIRSHPEWEAKLDRETFSDKNIAGALRRVRELFPEVRSS